MSAAIIPRLNRRISAGLAGSLAALLMASPAAAGVTASLVRNDLVYQTRGSGGFAPIDNGASLIDVSQGTNFAHGITFEALSSLTQNSILFRNSIIGSGSGTTMRATIGVEITLENTFGFAFTPVLRTKLLAAGMGLFFAAPVLANFAPGSSEPTNPTVLDCTASQLKNCTPITEQQIISLFDRPSDIFGTMATGFDFRVTAGGDTKYRMAAEIGYRENGQYYENIDQARLLDNFRRADAPGQLFTTAYAWDDTFVDITLGDTLAPGASLTAVYTISTYLNIGNNSGDFVRFVPIEGGGQNLVITPGGFAAFGDPIGGNGTIDDAAAFRGMASELAALPPLRINTNGTGQFELPFVEIDPINQTVLTVLDAQTLQPPPDELPYGPLLDPVPEPASWLLLILGFGLVGGVMRRHEARPA